MDFWKEAGGVLGTVAPVLATAVGGPLAGVATKAIVSALGLDAGTSPEQAALAVTNATPDQLILLKRADQEFAAKMKELDIDLVRVEVDNTKSAREMQIAVRDWIPGALALVLTSGFFGVLGWLMTHGMPPGASGSEAMLVMLGALGGAFGAVVNFYYGSSAGSMKKDETIKAMVR